MGLVTVRRVYAQVLQSDYRPVTIRRAYAQVLTVENVPANLRTVRGQFLQFANDPAALRQVRGMFLTMDAVIPNLLLDFKANLLSKINKVNNTTFTVNDVDFGPPSPLVGERRNSQLTVTARHSSGHSKDVVIQYDRTKIDLVIKDSLTRPLDLTGLTLVSQTLPQINTRYNLALTATDVVEKEIKPGQTSFTLTMAGTSLYFYPGSTIQFGSGIELATEFDQVDLVGFGLPTFAERFPVQDLPSF
ncbi:hypothetical protein D3C80_495370 [compost metagenome]